MRCGLSQTRPPRSYRRQLGRGRDHPVDDERQNQVAIASRRRSAEPLGQQLRQVQELGRAEHREAIAAAGFGWLILGEPVGAVQALGGLAILPGIYVARPR